MDSLLKQVIRRLLLLLQKMRSALIESKAKNNQIKYNNKEETALFTPTQSKQG